MRILLIVLIFMSIDLLGNPIDTTGVYLNKDIAVRVARELIISEELQAEVDSLNAEIVVLDMLYNNAIQMTETKSSQLSSLISQNESFERSLGLKDDQI